MVATEITVIRTRPSQYVKKKSVVSFFYPLIFRDYPLFAEAMKQRPEAYMEAVFFIKQPPAGVRVFEIAPPPNIDVGRYNHRYKTSTRRVSKRQRAWQKIY